MNKKFQVLPVLSHQWTLKLLAPQSAV